MFKSRRDLYERFQWFQIYSGLLSRIHPICKAMGLVVNTHAPSIWKVLWRFFSTSGPFTTRNPCCRPCWCFPGLSRTGVERWRKHGSYVDIGGRQQGPYLRGRPCTQKSSLLSESHKYVRVDSHNTRTLAFIIHFLIIQFSSFSYLCKFTEFT